jgi:concentrative nucleoside transporter, CNT family
MTSEQKTVPTTEPTVAPEHRTDFAPEEGNKHITHHDIPEHGHNPSLQKDATPNPDLALHYSHEHQHDHMHHGRPSLAGRHDDILYAKGTEFEKSHVPEQDHSHHHHTKAGIETSDHEYSGSSDAEKGGVQPTRIDTNETDDPKKHRFSRFYRKYKIFFHIFIWLFFTG